MSRRADRTRALSCVVLLAALVAGQSAWAGYRPVWVPGSVYVRAGDRDRLPATVRTKIKPRKATVVVDGETVGKAGDYDGDWNVLVLEPGRHVIEFAAPGFRTLRTVLDARAGSQYRIGERLEKGEGLDPRSAEDAAARRPSPSVRTGLLWLRVVPEGASIYLDGRFLGSAEELGRMHGAIPVAPGEHRVDVVMPGYAPESRRVTIGGDEAADVRIELRRERR